MRKRKEQQSTLLLIGLVSLLSACGGNTVMSPNALQAPVAPAQMPVREERSTPQVLYVPDPAKNQITTYRMDGRRVAPTITRGLAFPFGIAVDAKGKIYVTNSSSGDVTTYLPDGTETTPTITGLKNPEGIAVDRHGKIYVVSAGYSSCAVGSLTTYNPDGTQTTPSISLNGQPAGVAVDGSGKIFVSLFCAGPSGLGEVNAYEPDGTQTTPTITDSEGIITPLGVTIADGKLFVADSSGGYFWGSVTAYRLDGKQVTPTLSKRGIDGPVGVAVDREGKIFVSNQLSGSYGEITSFLPTGASTGPTIINGIRQPNMIAVSP
jgi:DNA-binding beta-propeller fold protein YncE